MKDITPSMNVPKKKDDLYKQAVTQGAIFVSKDGSRRFDLGRFADMPKGRQKLLDLAKTSKK